MQLRSLGARDAAFGAGSAAARGWTYGTRDPADQERTIARAIAAGVTTSTLQCSTAMVNRKRTLAAFAKP